MQVDVGFTGTGGRQEPVADRLCVGHGLDRGEGLGGDDEQAGFGVDLGQGVLHVGGIDVGDKLGAQ